MDRRWDYIVVGAGSAGIPLAVRLSEDPACQVLLMEAGPADPPRAARVPAAFPTLFGTGIDWNYRTEPQARLGGRRISWPRGRILGGSSQINAMMWVRGFAADYDEWSTRTGGEWCYETMLRHFLTIEDTEDARPHQGRGGPISVRRQRDPHWLTAAFLDACAEVGLARAADVNDAEPRGVARTMVTQRDGSRWSTADGYLAGAADRPNLTVLTRARATRVTFSGRRATGVCYVRDERPALATAVREVVLCAGAVNSPHLLLLSGVGPARELRRVGIPVVHDAPGVGRDLRDHLFVQVSVPCRAPDTLHNALSPRALAQHRIDGRGPLTSCILEAYAFVRSRRELPLPDLELVFAPGPLPQGGAGPTGPAVTVGTVLLRPASTGRIGLRSADPLADPVVDPGYLTDPEGADLSRLHVGLVWCARVLAAPALRRHLAGPVPRIRGRAGRRMIMQHAQTLYHPVGTCRMGADAGSVVDPRLRVRGVDGLRVADAAVFPTLVRGHTHAPSVAVGEQAAILIRTG